jgi:single-stranded DNA-binding protein
MSSPGTRKLGLTNHGTFEGFVGMIPEVMTNKLGTEQCYLHVGHTPRYREDGKWKMGKFTVWVQFSCFGHLARIVSDRVGVGERVLVEYRLSTRYHPKYKRAVAFEAVEVRPIAKFFQRDEEAQQFAEKWRPRTARKSVKWEKIVTETEEAEEAPSGALDEGGAEEDRVA